ncbi:MAG: hypothetical protein ACXWWX_05930 [Actinomycetota bacterium]
MGLDPDLEAVVAVVPGWRGHEPTITPIEAGRTNRNFRVGDRARLQRGSAMAVYRVRVTR